MAAPRSALPGQTQGIFGEIMRRSAMESGGDPMKRIQLMQDYMGQATPQVIEATGRETSRRQGKEVARAGVQAKTEGDIAIGEARLEMNRKISEEAESVAKQTALISAGATLLGQMATTGIESQKKRATAHAKGVAEKAALISSEANLRLLGQVATGEIKAKPPVLVWPKGMDPKSGEAGEYVLEQFWGGVPESERMAKYDEWFGGLGTKKPRDWKGAFDMLSAVRSGSPPTQSGGPPLRFRPSDSRLPPLDESLRPSPSLDLSPEQLMKLAPPAPLLSSPSSIPGVDSPLDPLDNFGWGRMI